MQLVQSENLILTALDSAQSDVCLPHQSADFVVTCEIFKVILLHVMRNEDQQESVWSYSYWIF